MCDNCQELSVRVDSLRKEVIQLEERRSRERARHLKNEQALIQNSVTSYISPEAAPCTTCARLLELLGQLIKDNPDAKGLDRMRHELESLKI